jgi:DNA-binding response OmpR family regulator
MPHWSDLAGLSETRQPLLTNDWGANLIKNNSLVSGESMAQSILVVEDETVVRQDVCETLRKNGYDVVEASDGVQARDLLHVQRFDLVITDLVLPRLHGFDLVNLVRAKVPRTPIIVVSGYVSASAGTTILSGWAEFIAKPLDLNILLAMAQRILQRSLPVPINYRKKRGSQTWHFRSDCSNWPTSDYEEQSSETAAGEPCNECKWKQAQG